MKTTLLLIALIACSCKSAPDSKSHTSNPDIDVELLFVHDGIKAYRFNDGSRWVYYTDARGATNWTEGRHNTHRSVETVK